MRKTLFITGTDTGVGKTLLAGLLLSHLRGKGVRALAIKPFCTGGRADVHFLNSLQDNELTEEEITPFYFPEPVAPAVAAARHGGRIALETVLCAIERVARRCDWLIVEGAGGLLVPLGDGFTVEDLASRLKPNVCVAARNQLGAINHVLLTFYRLRQQEFRRVKVVLLGTRTQDLASKTNAAIIKHYIGYENVISIDYLGAAAKTKSRCKKNAEKVKKTLELILGAKYITGTFDR